MTKDEIIKVANLRIKSESISSMERAGITFMLSLLDMLEETGKVPVLSAVDAQNNADTQQITEKVQENGESSRFVEGEDSSKEGSKDISKKSKKTDKPKAAAGAKRIIECERCGKEIEAKSNRTKYCSDCGKIVKLEKNREALRRRRQEKALDEMEDARMAAEELARM